MVAYIIVGGRSKSICRDSYHGFIKRYELSCILFEQRPPHADINFPYMEELDIL